MVGTAVQRIAHCDDNAMITTMTDDTIMNMSNSSNGSGTSSVSSEGCDGLEVDVAVTLALMVGVLMVSVLFCLFNCSIHVVMKCVILIAACVHSSD